MRSIAILTFDGFNEIDSFVALNLLNRVPTFRAEIACPGEIAVSMNRVSVAAQHRLEFASRADAVLIGSGRDTAEIARDENILSRLRVDPDRQLIASQCSGALLLWEMGLIADGLVCTDSQTAPLLEQRGATVLDTPFTVSGNVASAGGCLAGHYLACWMIWRLAGKQAMSEALARVAPVGEEDEYLRKVLEVVGSFVGLPA